MESTLVEVLILKDLGKRGFYKVVIWEGLKILRGFEGLHGGDA